MVPHRLYRDAGRGEERSAPGFRGHRPGRRFWSSVRRATARSPDSESPLCATRLLVSGDDGTVDQHVFEVRIFRQALENSFEDARPHPAAEALKHAVPIAELGWKVAPWHARAHPPQDRFQE